jgi:hypothetical protein
MPYSSYGLHSVRDEVVSITHTKGKTHHVSVFSASDESHSIASQRFRTVAKIKIAIDNVATKLVDNYVVHRHVTVMGQYLMPTQNVYVKYSNAVA